LPILVQKDEGYEIPNGLIGEFTRISKEYSDWKNHYLFKILKNAGPKFIKHPISDGFDLSKKIYIENRGPTVLVFDQLMEYDAGSYQISFENVDCTALEDIEVGVLPITKNYKEGDIHNRDYGVNFAGHPLKFKKFLQKIKIKYLKNKNKQIYIKTTNNLLGVIKTPKDSILTLRLNTPNGVMIFFVNSTPMHYICDVDMSYSSYKFFIYTKGYDTTVRMTQYKHVNNYLDDIDYDLAIDPDFNIVDDSFYNLSVDPFDRNYYSPRKVKNKTSLL
jgi:hypothetical protein